MMFRRLALSSLALAALAAPARAQSLSSGVLIADLNPGTASSSPAAFYRVGPRVVFVAATPGATLWSTDGTRAGTARVLTSDGSSVSPNYYSIYSAGSFIIFNATGGVWRSDGTSAGTFRLTAAAMFTQFLNSPGYHPAAATSTDGVIYFPAQLSGDPDGLQLYRTDGSVAGTYKITTLAGGYHLSSILAPVALGTRVMFNDTSPLKQYLTDGTLAGTQFYYQGPSAPWLHVATSFPGAPAAPLAIYDRNAFVERSDGTATGTFPIAAIWGSTLPHAKIPAGDRVYFTPSSSPPRLMVSDGTLPGTYDIAALDMTDGAAIGVGRRAVLACLSASGSGNLLYAVDDSGNVQQIGSLAVTTGFRSTSFAVENGIAYVQAAGSLNQVYRTGIYRSDGTPAGTWCVSLVSNLVSNTAASTATPFLAKLGNRILYAGSSTTFGTELFGADIRPPVDCNNNGIDDHDEIATGAAFDANHNGVLDSCECLADWNGGGVSTQDVFDFLSDWFGPGADFNHSGATTVEDIFAFLNAWLAGC